MPCVLGIHHTQHWQTCLQGRSLGRPGNTAVQVRCWQLTSKALSYT